ncbi:uncharacterized protein LOC117104902 [Anneissia japonica]|uniref:uncharacterized protein LOC117104902 n=1 Tax=Anneissia japonica TaxID=1529436 RepID=UPI0014255A2C|nr:uncharacterized protein LOC117104902 [Anneissia japonica]
MYLYTIGLLFVFMAFECHASHFRGAYITYEPGPNPGEIRVSYRVSWRRDSKPHNDCTQTAIDSRKKLWGESYLECDSCVGPKIRLGYQCTDLSLEENWVTGIGTHTFKLKEGMDKSFQMRFVDCCWIELENFGESIGWSIVPRINLNPRPDNGLLNSSPVTSMLPIIRIPKGCNRKITVPVTDPDEDEVRCRWPKADLGECVPERGRRPEKVACNQPASFSLDEMKCKLSFDASGDIGWYAAAVMIEDFAVDYPDDALSSVPLQFLVDVFDSESNCDVFPVFVEPSALSACYVVPVGETFSTQLIARSSSPDISITEIQTISPVGMKKSPLMKLPGSRTDYFVNITWTPTADQVGEKILCYYAKDSKKMASDQTCMSLVIIREMVEIKPMLSDPSPEATISARKSEITIRFSKDISRDTAPAAVKIVKRSGKFLLEVEPATSDLVTFPTDDPKAMVISTEGVEFRGEKKYFLQVFPTASRYSRINSKCVSVGTWSWMFNTASEHCNSSPCENEGLCVELEKGYECECIPGYQGKHCEEDINECSALPCLNGGTCHEGVGTFSCSCLQGFTGNTCEKENDECWSLPCQNGASCIDKVDSFECQCADGYVGTLCESELNECSSNPCGVGGYCVDLPGAFMCFCNSGYEGKFCEIDTDECASEPCENGATCVDKPDYFQCICAPGFSGYYCETNINECDSSPCANGGFCIDQADGFVCECARGYAQPNCKTEINECESDPCQNGGECVDKMNSFKCKCKEGYKGKLCQNDRNECYNLPCKNGGTCVNTFGSYDCICETGFIGKNCAANEDDCLSTPCMNGATCIDKVGGVTCKCPSGYEGEFCESDINECFGNPCKHGGTCTDKIDGFACSCIKGYTGNVCETDIDECMSDPCQNGGVCVDRVNSYACVCAPGFEGFNCDIDRDECLSNPCLNEGECKDRANGYDCICPYYRTGQHCESYVITGWDDVMAAELQQPEMIMISPPSGEVHAAEAVCMETYMIVYIAKKFFGDIKAEEITLTDRNCVGARHNATHFSIGAAYGKCGTVADEKGSHVIFRNEIKFPHDSELNDNGISLPDAIHVECIMGSNADVSINYIPQIDNVIVDEKGYGNLEFGLNMYRDSSYRYTKDEFPADIAMEDRIYFGTRLYSRPELQLFIESCIASPSSIRQAADSAYTFIENGCSLDPTLTFHTSPSTTEVRFSIEALSFVDFDVEPMVYIHCQVKLCDMKNVSSECIADCSRQEKTGPKIHKRSTELNKDRTLTSQGGIRIRRNSEGTNFKESRSIVVLSLSLTIVFLLAVIIGLLIVGNYSISKSRKSNACDQS